MLKQIIDKSIQSAQLHASADNTIKVSGALVFSTVNALWQQSQRLFIPSSAHVKIDLQAVTQSDSAGVALLLAWMRSARTHQKKIEFLALPEQMLAIIKVSDLENIL